MEKNIQLTDLQQKAADMIEKWFNSYKDTHDQVFVLAGYAGTGKTFLVNHIIKDILKLNEEYDVAFVAPTGKAANVLIQRGALNATTIHRLIYRRVTKKYETQVGDKIITSEKTEFVKKESITKYKLIVLDETSMVDSKIMGDLVSFGIPILCCGDPFQLPPPAGSSNGLLDRPNITLTEIVRQSEDNAIVSLATKIRNGEDLHVGNYGDVVVVSANSLTPERRCYLLTKADQVICGTNARRKIINKEIKKYLGFKPGEINIGEKIICLLNNWDITVDDNDEYYLVNGMIGYVRDFSELKGTKNKLGVLKLEPDFISTISNDLVYDTGNFTSNDERSYYDFHQSVYLMSDGSYEVSNEYHKGCTKDELLKFLIQKRDAIRKEQLNFFDSAYCISCHKSQGAEWDNVVVFDESHVFGKEWRRWLYTAITRARKKLVIII